MKAFEDVELDAIDTLDALQAALNNFVSTFIVEEKSFAMYSSYINAFEQSRGDVAELMQVSNIIFQNPKPLITLRRFPSLRQLSSEWNRCPKPRATTSAHS